MDNSSNFASKLAGALRRHELGKGLDTPSQNPFGQYAQGVAQRVLHPMETIANVAQQSMDNPMDTALNWSNPVAGGLVGMFAGKGAKTANLAKLLQAQEMKAAGVADDAIHAQTGWFSGMPDGQWRFEIPDDAATIKASQVGDIGHHEYGSVIAHPELTQAYPRMQDIQFSHEAKAYFNPNENRIAIDKAVTGKFGDQQIARAQERLYKVAEKMQGKGTLTDSAEARLSAMLDSIGNNPRFINSADTKVFDKSTALHELQHSIQESEGFASGGSPEQFMRTDYGNLEDAKILKARITGGLTPSDAAKWMWQKLGRSPSKEALEMAKMDTNALYAMPSSADDAYRRLAGEAEARLTQARMNMTPEQRAASYPPSMFDVPVEQQIVRYK